MLRLGTLTQPMRRSFQNGFGYIVRLRKLILPICFDIYERVGVLKKSGSPIQYLGSDLTLIPKQENHQCCTSELISTRANSRSPFAMKTAMSSKLGKSQRNRKKINKFFSRFTRERLKDQEPFVAVIEVCGFNEWLIRMLRDYRCEKVLLIQPEERKNRKTDRRDAAALSELLWVNRDRIGCTTDHENRRLTTLRKNAGRSRARIINTVRHILRRHNLQWEMPTKRFPTIAAIAWLKKLELPKIDRLEIDHLLADLEQVQQRLKDLEKLIAERCVVNEDAVILATIPGVANYTAISLASRAGRIERFPRAHSLANYWGLTPGCRNSGENNQRLGSITKAGSGMARWLLGQATHKVLRKDAKLKEWFRRIKRRRGANIARVAVMRKLATVIWRMLTERKTYAEIRQLATE